MTTLHKIRYSDDEQVMTSIFLAKSEDHAKALFFRFHRELDKNPSLFQVIQLKADTVHDIHQLNQLKEGDTFKLAHHVSHSNYIWDDEYESGPIKYVKGPYDPTRHMYECTDEHGFLFYVKPYETIILI